MTTGERRTTIPARSMRVVVALLVALAATVPAPHVLAQDAVPVQAAPGEVAEPVYVARTRPDRIGRIMAPVFVNGQGPFAFVIDTGASRSVIAPRVAARLGLVPDPSHPLGLHGVTGVQVVPSILVDRLQAGDVTLRNQRLPVVVPAVFADADGILGVDGFARTCVFVSFANSSITIDRHGCPAFANDWPRAGAKLRFGGLVTIRARVGGKHVQAIVDTGAERTLGNLPLLKVLALDRRTDNPASDAVVLGATPERAAGNTITIPTLYLGEFQIAGLPVTFGDFEVFHLWGLDSTPALVIGMDVLGNADGLLIDYRHAELRVLPSGEGDAPRVRTDVMPGRLK